ncbi:MAG: helix-turn-helix domain-containing protein, partial [Clostridia bacterium]|nr:helix-turn-helix domain-containing protein [Clostridia bacterium]
MSIRVLTKNKSLAILLTLEAKRKGFCEESDPSILFVDLDTATPPRYAAGVPVVGLSADSQRLSDHEHSGFAALLRLPFSVKDFADILPRLRGKSQIDAPRCVDGILWLEGQRIPLCATEAALFDLLYRNRHRTVTLTELTDLLGDSAKHTNKVAVYLYRLRRKLSADGISRIRTVRGEG